MFNNAGFGQSPFGSQQSGPKYEDIMRQVQFNQMTQQNIYVQQNSAFDEYSKLLQDLTQEEQSILVKNEEYVNSRIIFEQGFSEFLASKFKDEYISTKGGESCMKNLMDTTKNVIGKIKDEVKEERERLRTLSKLLQDNPNILDEIISAKNAQKDATVLTQNTKTNEQKS